MSDEENTETTQHATNNNIIIENPPILIETLEKYILEHNSILDKIL